MKSNGPNPLHHQHNNISSQIIPSAQFSFNISSQPSVYQRVCVSKYIRRYYRRVVGFLCRGQHLYSVFCGARRLSAARVCVVLGVFQYLTNKTGVSVCLCVLCVPNQNIQIFHGQLHARVLCNSKNYLQIRPNTNTRQIPHQPPTHSTNVHTLTHEILSMRTTAAVGGGSSASSKWTSSSL